MKKADNALSKEIREQSVFKRFLELRGLQQAIFESRKPPEPDILLYTEVDKIAFELLECANENIIEVIKTFGRKMPEREKTKLFNHFGKKGHKVSEDGFVMSLNTSEGLNDYRQKFKDKVAKTYISIHSIELLCYTANQIILPDDIRENIRSLAFSLSHKFTKIWFMGDDVYQIYPCIENF